MDPSAQLEFLRWALGVSVVLNAALMGTVYKHIREDMRVRDRVAKIEGVLGMDGR